MATLIGVLVLAGGISCSIAVFRVLDRFLLAPPPGVVDPQHLWHLGIGASGGTSPREFLSYAEVQNVGSLRPGVESAAYGQPDSISIALASAPSNDIAVQAHAQFVSNDYFKLVGVRLIIGRGIDESGGTLESPGSVVVLGYDLWRRIGGDRDLPLGALLRIRGRVFTLIGVTAPGFVGVNPDPTNVWLPLGVAALTGSGAPSQDLRSGFYFGVLVRFRAHTLPAARRAMLVPALFGTPEPGAVETTPDADRVALRATSTPEWATDGVHLPLAIMLGAVCGGILLIACGNVTSLLLARAMRGASDVRLQLALGAGRWRILAQQFFEGAQVVFLGSVIGLAAGEILYTYAYRLLAPRMLETAPLLDARTIAFDITVIAGVAILSLAAPMLYTWRLTSAPSGGGFTRDATRASLRWQRALIATQMALCFALVAGAGLFLKSFRTTLSSAVGMQIPGLLYVDLASLQPDAPTETNAALNDAQALAERVRRYPRVRDAAIGSALALHQFTVVAVKPPDAVRSRLRSMAGFYVTAVTPAYFSTMGTTLLRGRGFTNADRAGAPLVTVVNQTLAETFWQGADPLGKCLDVGPPPFQCYTVVGVVADPPGLGLRRPPVTQYFISASQRPALLSHLYLFVRYAGEERAGIALLRSRLLTAVPPGAHPVVGSLRALAEPEIRPLRVTSSVLGLVSLIGLVLAGAGVYAVTLYHVQARMREFGIRIAVGATEARIVWSLLRDVLMTAAIGGVAGAVLIAWFGRYLAPLLFHVSPYDAVTYVVSLGVLLTAAAASIWTPARLIRRIDLREILAGDVG